MLWVRSPVYFYNRNGTYYFSRAVPSDLRHRFPKRKIEVSLRTKSESKAAGSAAALSNRLERYWDSLRMEMIYSKELGLTVLPETRTVAADSFSLTDGLALYRRLKSKVKTSLFFKSSKRSIRHLGYEKTPQPGCHKPFSVIMPVIKCLGVTSKAGFKASVLLGHIFTLTISPLSNCPCKFVTSSKPRSSIGISVRPSTMSGSMVDVGIAA